MGTCTIQANRTLCRERHLFYPVLYFSLPPQHMEGFEGSFFEDLRQLEFEEKARVQSASGTTLEAVSGTDPLIQGIYNDEESVDLSALLAFDDNPYSTTAASGKDNDSLAIVSSSFSSAADLKSLNNTSTSSWPHSSCSEVNVNFSFRNYLPPVPTTTANHNLSMYDISGIGNNPSNNMPVNVETVQIDVPPQPTTQANGTTTHHPIGMSPHVGSRPAPGKATKTKKKRMPDKGTNEYRQKRDRNNVAVRKSREKTKVRVLETEQRVKELEDENQRLQSKITLLSKELNVLKSLFTSAGVSQPASLKVEPQSSASHAQ